MSSCHDVDSEVCEDCEGDGGFGIGAFEAREMIKAMGGRLTVESREGMGTRFCVLLPIAEAAGLIAQHSQSDTQTENQEVA